MMNSSCILSGVLTCDPGPVVSCSVHNYGTCACFVSLRQCQALCLRALACVLQHLCTLSPEQVASPSCSRAKGPSYALSTLPRAAEGIKEAQVLLGLLEKAHFHNQLFEKLASFYYNMLTFSELVTDILPTGLSVSAG